MRKVAYACLDLETTSADVDITELREIALLPLDENFNDIEEREPFVEIVRNIFPSEPEAFAVHHIADWTGIPLDDAIERMRWHIRNVWEIPDGERLHLVGHNIGIFDAPILRRVSGFRLYNDLFHYRVRDTSIVARALCDAGILPPSCAAGKLVDLCSALGFSMQSGAVHRALADVKDEAALYRAMLAKLRSYAGSK